MNILKAFQKKSAKQIKDASFIPSGLIGLNAGNFYYVKGNKRFKFVSERAMKSWCLPVLKIDAAFLNKLTSGGTLGFRDGSLVKDISDGKIYLISDSKRRHVVDPDILEWIDTEIISAGQKEILVHIEGEPISGS
jgi:hypothetical protein